MGIILEFIYGVYYLNLPFNCGAASIKCIIPRDDTFKPIGFNFVMPTTSTLAT